MMRDARNDAADDSFCSTGAFITPMNLKAETGTVNTEFSLECSPARANTFKQSSLMNAERSVVATDSLMAERSEYRPFKHHSAIHCSVMITGHIVICRPVFLRDIVPVKIRLNL